MKHIIYLFVFPPIMMWGQSDFDKAEQLYKANKMDQAELAFESVFKSSPSNLKTIEYLGDIAGHNKSWDKAIGYYKN
jgi:predicted Zn-dependent protease